MNQPRQVIIHRSLTRPILLGGGERELVILNFTLAMALIFGVGIYELTVVSAIFLLTIGHVVLVKLAKLDPLFSKVYKRHMHYKDYYPAKSSHLAKPQLIKPSIYT